MMFEIKLMISLVFLSIFYYTTCATSEFKGKQSMMEYMNQFFTPDNAEFQFNANSKARESEVENHRPYRFSESRNQTAPATNATAAGGAAAQPKEPTEEELSKMVLEDWLMISSPLFLDIRVFPVVTLPNGVKAKIHTDASKFRLNDAFFAPSGEKPPSSREFWFRLSGLNIYYSVSKKDINILGAISIKTITNAVLDTTQIYVGNNATYCFTVWDTNYHDWRVCSFKEEVSHKWVCAIQKLLGESPKECNGNFNATKVEVIEKKITQPIIIIPLPSHFCNEDWNYKKQGSDWECDCKEGKEQSPIDLPPIEKAIDSPVKPFFQYDRIAVESPVTTIEGYQTKGSKIQFQYLEGALKLIYHKIGKVVTIDGAIYFAQEIIFHTPAEHTINGKKYDMEIQIVHYGQTVGDIAKQVVLSFLIEKSPGVYNQFVDDFDIFNLPTPTETKRNLQHEIYVPKIFFEKKEDGTGEIAYWKPFSFYTYQGSLSFPPCTENTIVYVAQKPVKLGSTALALFQEALRIPDMINDATGDVIVSNWATSSARKIQPLNGRPVFYYDHQRYCGPDREEQKKPDEGHYEKVQTTLTKYFYVNKEVPSGLPHSFVVPKSEATGEGDPQANPAKAAAK
jgi:carbonic anhydrase